VHHVNFLHVDVRADDALLRSGRFLASAGPADIRAVY
jgi:hypothetical protein